MSALNTEPGLDTSFEPRLEREHFVNPGDADWLTHDDPNNEMLWGIYTFDFFFRSGLLDY